MRHVLAATLAAVSFLAIAPAQQQCTQQAYGDPCGPTLTVSFYPIGDHHKLSVLMQNGFPHSSGLWIWGVQNLAWPIPGSQCHLYTDFVYGHPFMSEPDGSRLMEHAWPLVYNGLYVRLQAASVGIDGNNNLVIHTTNGVYATCTGS